MNSEGAHIYHGAWINWSQGRIYGATVTLSARDGSLLTAFLAFFVTVAASHLWRILSYLIHQARASRRPQDGLKRQQQAVLRNSSSTSYTAWTFALIGFHWWYKARRPFLRSVPWIIFVLAYATAAGLASVFSSEVTKAVGTDALILGPNCGFWSTPTDPTVESQAAFRAKTLQDTLAAADYARACYGATSGQSRLRCNVYSVPQVGYDRNYNASCPFAAEMCLMPGTTAFEMDTGLLDSHDTLGINAPPQNRVQYRKVTTCAPLTHKGFVGVYNSTGAPSEEGSSGDFIFQFLYGPTYNGTRNSTLDYNTRAAVALGGYSLWAFTASTDFPHIVWEPIPQLNRSDADVTIIMVAPNGIQFAAPSDDPFFPAHEEVTLQATLKENTTTYLSDTWVNAMGCTEQYQFCNPVNGRCTPLRGSDGLLIRDLADTGMNEFQLGARIVIGLSLRVSQLSFIVDPREENALRVQDTVNSQIQAPIPSNQWTIEASSWFDAGLALLQSGLVEYATGPTSKPSGSWISRANDTISRAMCRNQKVRATDGSISFSLLGTGIILVLGGAIIVTNLVLDVVVGFIQHRVLHRGEYRRLQWILDDTLQLQRLAYEEAGMGTWSGTTSAVPTTLPGELLGGFDDTVDPNHPRLPRTGGYARSSDGKADYSYVPGPAEAGPLMGGDYKQPHTSVTER